MFVNERGSQCSYEGKGGVSGEKEKDELGGKGAGGAHGFEKRGNPTRVCEREGPLCTCEGRGAVSENRKMKKKKRRTIK